MKEQPPDTGRSTVIQRLLRAILPPRPAQVTGQNRVAGKSAAAGNGAPSLDDMAQGLNALNDIQIRDIMVPRSDVVFVYADESLHDALQRVIASGFSRLPVADEGENKVLGVLHAKDLLSTQIKEQHASTKELMRPVQPVPESMRARTLLEEMRQNHLHLAPVVDEYGGIAGIVTLEDIIEEIVGEIKDEYEKKSKKRKISAMDDHTWMVRANTSLAEFNEFFNTDWQDKNTEIIGDIVLKKLGHTPKKGEQLTLGEFEITMERVSRGRLQIIRLQKSFASTAPAGEIS